jgi:hypothetical protein
MRTARIFLVDGKYTDTYVLGQIDTTHLYMKRVEKGEDSVANIEKGMVYHVGQLRYNAPLYQAVWDWLRGLRELENVGFEEAV